MIQWPEYIQITIPSCFTSYPLVMFNSLLLNMAIEIVSFPIINGDFP